MAEQIVVDNVSYGLYEFHGKVIDQQASSETRVSGGGSYVVGNNRYYNPVVSHSYTTKEFFIVNEAGKEKDFSFTDKDIPAIRPSHIVQVKWLIREGDERGPYVVVHNHSLDKYFVDEIMIAEAMYGDKRHLGNRLLFSTVVGVIGLGCIVYAFVAESFSSTFFFFVLGASLLVPYINLFRFISEFKKNTREMKSELIKRIRVP